MQVCAKDVGGRVAQHFPTRLIRHGGPRHNPHASWSRHISPTQLLVAGHLALSHESLDLVLVLVLLNERLASTVRGDGSHVLAGSSTARIAELDMDRVTDNVGNE